MSDKRRSSDPRLDRIEEALRKIEVALLGDIESGKDGFITRYRLTEASLARLWKFTGAIAIALSIKMVIGAFI